MNDQNKINERIPFIIAMLSKIYAALELKESSCPFCSVEVGHDEEGFPSCECPIALAWSLLDETKKAMARRNVGEMLGEGVDDLDSDPNWPDFLELSDLFDKR